MSRESFIIILGLAVLFVPQLGIPSEWKQDILLGSGILLLLVGYSLRRSAYLRTIDQGNGERGTDTFTESNARPMIIVEDSV